MVHIIYLRSSSEILHFVWIWRKAKYPWTSFVCSLPILIRWPIQAVECLQILGTLLNHSVHILLWLVIVWKGVFPIKGKSYDKEINILFRKNLLQPEIYFTCTSNNLSCFVFVLYLPFLFVYVFNSSCNTVCVWEFTIKLESWNILAHSFQLLHAHFFFFFFVYYVLH